MEEDDDHELSRALKLEQERAYLEGDSREEDEVISADEGDTHNLGQEKHGEQERAEVARPQVSHEEAPELNKEIPHMYQLCTILTTKLFYSSVLENLRINYVFERCRLE